jgi:PAS domain S-box-containing protein
MLKNLTDPYEAVGMKRDGTQFPIKIQSKTIRYKDNQLVRATSIMDVSDLKRKEKELHESEEKFRILYDLSPQSIALTNIRTGKLVNVNKKFCALTGYSKSELSSATVTELGFYSNPDRKKFLTELEKSGEVQGLEMDFRTKDGSRLNALMFAKLINISGEPLILTIFTDLTFLKKMESRLRQSQKMETIGTLAGGIAHDFNNILTPIMGHTEILLANRTLEKPFRASLEQILAGAMRASELVKQILTFSSHTNNVLEPMRMEPVISEALKLIRSTIPTTIEITQDLQSAYSVVKADPTQVHQIMMNLTTNAYHAMEKSGGTIRVRFKEVQLGEHDVPEPDMQPGAYVCLSVADTGTGMDKDLSGKIFEPFFTTKKKGKGTGMGLSVIYGIVKSMGGSIQVYSEPEKGSEFKLYFPTEKEPFTEKQNHVQEEIPSGTERILLVDDEEPIITMTKTMLELLGYHVTAHLNSIDALQSFQNCPDDFDLVITDMAMPAMSGDTLSVELTKIRPDIPILLCTGFSETMTEEKAAFLGISGFLLKPIIMKDFSRKIRDILDKSLLK